MNQLLKQRIAQLKNGEIPTGYKKTEFGIFPCDWEIVSIGSVSTNRGEYGLNAPARTKTDGLPKYIRITDIDENGNYVDNGACVDYSDTNGQYTLKPGDIVFARTGASVGRNYLYKIKDGDLVFAGFLIKFSVDEKVSNPYIVYTNCNTKTYHDWVKKISARSGQPGINAEEYCTYKFCKPKSLSEQAKIAEILMTWEKAIELHKQQIGKLKQFKSVCLKKMFPAKGQTVPEWRFKGFTDAWEQRKWCNTVDISTEMVDPTSGEYDDMPHIAPGNIESFTGRVLDNVKTVKEEHLISGKFRFRPGDVVYGKINPQLGKYFYAGVDGLTSADAYVFNGKNGVTQKFLFSLLQTDIFFKYSVSVSKRSGMPKINRDELNEYSFLAPNEQEQERIGDFLLIIDNLITLHQRKVETYQKQYRILQQYLINGIVRV